jgi:hypothetical protein
VASSRFQRIALWGLASVFLVCGAAALLQGFWQLFLGRKNKWLLLIIIAAAVVVAASGVAASIYTGCPIGRICQ